MNSHRSSVIGGASLEQSTEGSSQQQSAGNSNDRPTSLQTPDSRDGQPSPRDTTVQSAPPTPDASIHRSGELLKLCDRCQGLDEDQRDPQRCNDCVYASGDGETGTPHPSDPQTPSKTASPKKVPGVWCDDCTRLKTQPGEDGRTRRNAKYRCQKCAALREKAGLSRGKKSAGSSSTPDGQGTPPARQAPSKQGNSLPTPAKAGKRQAFTRKTVSAMWQKQNNGQSARPGSSKPWKLPVGSKQQQERNRGFDPSTESDDPDNLPKPNRSNPQVDEFGTPRDHSETIRQVQENVQRWDAQPPAAAFSGPNSLNEDSVSNQSSRYGNHTQPLQRTPQMDNYTSYPTTGNASGPQQRQPGEDARLFSLFPPEPPTYPGAPAYPGAPSGPSQLERNTGFPSPYRYTYPDPMELDGSSSSNHSIEDMWTLWLSDVGVPMHHSNFEPTGLSSTGNTAAYNQLYSNTFVSSSPAPFDFPDVPGSANPAPAPAPAYPLGSQRHPGLRPGSRDPTLSGAPRRPAASPPLDPALIDPRLLDGTYDCAPSPAPDLVMPDSAEPMSQNNGSLTYETEEDLYSP